MHTWDIYLEYADTDDERTFIGRIDADTQSGALDLAAQYFEYAAHDLVALRASPGTLTRCPYCRQMHETHLIELCPMRPKHGKIGS